MSFYSSLILAANEDVRPPTPEAMYALFDEFGLLEPNNQFRDPFWSLAGHVTKLFDDPAAHAKNSHFFTPDTISFHAEIQILDFDGVYEGPGWCVAIHGNGYLYPWELTDVRDRVVRSPALTAFRVAVEERFGSRFVFPPAAEAYLRSRLIDDTSNWLWFACESG